MESGCQIPHIWMGAGAINRQAIIKKAMPHGGPFAKVIRNQPLFKPRIYHPVLINRGRGGVAALSLG